MHGSSSVSITGGWLLALFLILKPFYLWSSGLPQIADIALLLLVTHRLFSQLRHPRAAAGWNPFPVIAALFLFWSTIVNLSAALLVGNVAQFVTASAMNAYNIAVAITIFNMFLKGSQSVAKALYIGSLASIVIQTALLVAGTISSGLRATGTFNNPNQLAFHSILIIALLLISHQVLQPSTVWWTYLGVVLSCICVALSLSRGGAVAAIILLVGILIAPPTRGVQRWQFRAVLASSAIGLVVLLWSTQNPKIVSWMESFAGRAAKQDAAGFEATRGYDRILEYPEYWFFGAGEGAYWRFDAWSEFHSTLGTIQVSYGLIGLALFILLVALSLVGLQGMRIRVLHTSVVLAIMAYGFSHNGLRSTLSWIIFAILAAWGTSLGTRSSTTKGISPRGSGKEKV